MTTPLRRRQPPAYERAIPCRHGLRRQDIDEVKKLLTTLPLTAPQLLRDRGIPEAAYEMLLRAAVESLRGTSAATMVDKKRFIEAVLDYGLRRATFEEWRFIGTAGRQDYQVILPGGVVVGVEAKGCPDGNNTTIWDRPGWADEFVVWSLCPESLAKHPGHGVFSGVATRLIPKVAAERKVVDAFIFWDGRCGSSLRRCPKQWGVRGSLRGVATDIPGQEGLDWLPPPCIYLFPSAYPHSGNNPKPRVHTVSTSRFSNALLKLFNVPEAERSSYVHSVGVEARGTQTGTEIQVTVVSRCWPDSEERAVTGKWKPLKRE